MLPQKKLDPLASIEPRGLGSRLREAREARSWTQQQLAEKLGMARTTVVAIEKGERRLKPAELLTVANLLGKGVSELLQSSAPADGFAVRLRGLLPAMDDVGEDVPSLIQQFQDCAEDYLRLEDICEAPLRRRYPAEYDIQGNDPELAAEDVAESERKRLDLGEGPLADLRGVLEADVGLRVFQLPLPPRIAGMFAYTAHLGGCITVNLRHSTERKRMSLAHEYGHFLTARDRSEVTVEGQYERKPAGERFAEGFARAFLLPASGVRRRFLELERERFRGMTLGDLYRLAHSYGVSLETMTHRLEELRLIPVDTWDRARQERFKVTEPTNADDNFFPPRYIALAVEAWQREQISEGQLARFLRTDRLGARERIQRLTSLGPADTDQDEPLNLAEPLLRAASR